MLLKCLRQIKIYIMVSTCVCVICLAEVTNEKTSTVYFFQKNGNYQGGV